MKYFIFIIRILIGLMFIEAAYIKITQPDFFASAIRSYQLVPDIISPFFALIIPWIELLLGINLVAGIFVKTSAFISASLVGLFTLAVIYAILSGLNIDCGCGVSLTLSSEASWIKVAENLILILFLITIFYTKNHFGSLENKISFFK